MDSPGDVESSVVSLVASLGSSAGRLLSKRVVRELHLRNRFDTSPLKQERVRYRIPLGQVPDCENCDDNCCYGVENLVSLRIRDIARLIDIGRDDLISKKKPRFHERDYVQRPHLRDLVKSDLFRMLPVLRQEGPLRKCAALDGQMRCSLYPNWPLTCERFPYALQGLREARWGTRCPSSKMDLKTVSRSEEMRTAVVRSYNERIDDAVLLTHALPQLDELGIGKYIVRGSEDPFEADNPLPILG